MANNYQKENIKEKDFYVVLFVSRNKDNKDIPYFKERRMCFIDTLESVDRFNKIAKRFQDFISAGLPGEQCRWYISVNKRSNEKTMKAFQHFLIDNNDFSLVNAESKIAALAAKKENAVTNRWLFDVDTQHPQITEAIIDDIAAGYGSEDIAVHKTPHGYAVITQHGFDTRYLMSKWSEYVTVKKDDLLCYYWGEN